MKNKEIVILNKVIKYCLDIEYLMKKYKYDFEKYQNVLLVAVVGVIVAVRKRKIVLLFQIKKLFLLF